LALVVPEPALVPAPERALVLARAEVAQALVQAPVVARASEELAQARVALALVSAAAAVAAVVVVARPIDSPCKSVRRRSPRRHASRRCWLRSSSTRFRWRCPFAPT